MHYEGDLFCHSIVEIVEFYGFALYWFLFKNIVTKEMQQNELVVFDLKRTFYVLKLKDR